MRIVVSGLADVAVVKKLAKIKLETAGFDASKAGEVDTQRHAQSGAKRSPCKRTSSASADESVNRSLKLKISRCRKWPRPT